MSEIERDSKVCLDSVDIKGQVHEQTGIQRGNVLTELPEMCPVVRYLRFQMVRLSVTEVQYRC